MAKRITVNPGDIVVTDEQRTFGFSGKSTGAVVTVLEKYTMARFGRAENAVYAEICWKCSGSGFLRYYAGIFQGQCFPCVGAGTIRRIGKGTPLDIVRVLRARETAAARREANRLTEAEAKKAGQHEWLAANPQAATVSAYVRAAMDRDGGHTTAFSPMLQEMACKANNWPLSQEQVSFLLDLFAEDIAAEMALKAKTETREWVGAEGAKVTVTGKLVYTTANTKNYGGGDRTSTLFVIETETGDSVKWWWTGFYQPVRGTVYTVTGTVKEQGNTEKYGKYTQLTRVVTQAA